jgi:hypothetical protein
VRRIVRGRLKYTVKRWEKGKEYLPVIDNPDTGLPVAPLPTDVLRRLLEQAERYEEEGYSERRVTVERDS